LEELNPKPKVFNLVKQPIIGKSASLVNTIFDCLDQITIGDYVSFGHNCMVLTGFHDKYLKGKDRQDSLKFAPVTIKDGVWIASGVIICPGVTIGENAVIGAGSVVLKNVPSDEFWAGVPAKFIRLV
jgi:maltose O-acetyltransferase